MANFINSLGSNNTRCLICDDAVDQMDLLKKVQSSCPSLLSSSLKVYFVLKHVLLLPEERLIKYLQNSGSLEAFVRFCGNCNVNFVDKCLQIHGELIDILKRQNEAHQQLRNAVTSSVVKRTRRSQLSRRASTSGNPVCEDILEFVLKNPEQDDSDDVSNTVNQGNPCIEGDYQARLRLRLNSNPPKLEEDFIIFTTSDQLKEETPVRDSSEAMAGDDDNMSLASGDADFRSDDGEASKSPQSDNEVKVEVDLDGELDKQDEPSQVFTGQGSDEDSSSSGDENPRLKLPTGGAGRTKVVYDDVFLNLMPNQKTKLFKCPLCKVTNFYKSVVYGHYKFKHFKERIFKCTWPKCSRAFSQSQSLLYHVDMHKGTPRFPCDQCDSGFYSFRERRIHLEQVHGTVRLNRTFKCPICKKEYTNSTSLRRHKIRCAKRKLTVDGESRGESVQNTETNRKARKPLKVPNGPEYAPIAGLVPVEGIFLCPSCDFKTRRPDSMIRHFRTCHLRVRYPCTWPECGKDYSEKRFLRDHMDQHKGTPRYKCSHCSETFYQYHHYKNHRLDQSVQESLGEGTGGESEKVYQCGMQKGTNQIARKPLKAPDGPEYAPIAGLLPVEGKYVCPSCDFKTRRPDGLIKHFKTCHLRVRYPCTWPECGKDYSEKRFLRDHMDQHNGTPRYKCRQCSETFFQYHKYKNHWHMSKPKVKETKSYACDYENCGKTFKQKDTLKCHKKTKHLGLPPKKHGEPDRTLVVCSECGQSMQMYNLRNHMIQKHTEHTWLCSKCPRKFAFENKLKDHLRRKHGIGDEVEFRCQVPLCRKFYKTEKALNEHVEEVHGKDNSKPGQFKCQFCDKCFFLMSQLRQHGKQHESETSRI